ncbi:UDP-glycosyltransferase UGT4-like isoform X2 [Daktulosphaira vitifoliae]|nr:UDP-glycosyltransferase UGT4-like isoform X2 [Daktulosphaira vitifoliae]
MPSTYKYIPTSNVYTPNARKNIDHMKIRNMYRLFNMINVKLNMMKMVKHTLELNEIKLFLNDTKNEFDLVLIECWYNDVFLAIGERYSAPIICLSPMLPTAYQSSYLGVPINPAYIPSVWLYYSDKMSFKDRLNNFLMAIAELITNNILRINDQNMLEQLYEYPGHRNGSSLIDLKKNIALTFVNSHFSVSYSRPYPPNVIPVAGMHLRSELHENQKEHKQLTHLLDKAVNGVIYFSFGSIIKMSNLSKNVVQIFINCFKKLPQLVLWKWENGSIDNLPQNIYTAKWFPQQYILNHKNCRLFITHGGYHSLVEAIHFGLPIIGFPFFVDQYYNTKYAEEKGFGIEILIDTLNENILLDALAKVLLQPSYRINAEKMSKLISDFPKNTSLNTAVYWVEYVIRNGHGPHIYTEDLNWIQYLSIDIFILLILIFVLLIFTIFSFFYLLKNYIKQNI